MLQTYIRHRDVAHCCTLADSHMLQAGVQSVQPSMGPDAELFAEMAQDLLLGPAQTAPDPRPAQPTQPSHQSMQSAPQPSQHAGQSQLWQQRPASAIPSAPQAAPQQQQQQPQQGQVPSTTDIQSYSCSFQWAILHAVCSGRREQGSTLRTGRKWPKSLCELKQLCCASGTDVHGSRRGQHARRSCSPGDKHTLAWAATQYKPAVLPATPAAAAAAPASTALAAARHALL